MTKGNYYDKSWKMFELNVTFDSRMSILEMLSIQVIALQPFHYTLVNEFIFITKIVSFWLMVAAATDFSRENCNFVAVGDLKYKWRKHDLGLTQTTTTRNTNSHRMFWRFTSRNECSSTLNEWKCTKGRKHVLSGFLHSFTIGIATNQWINILSLAYTHCTTL